MFGTTRTQQRTVSAWCLAWGLALAVALVMLSNLLLRGTKYHPYPGASLPPPTHTQYPTPSARTLP